MLISAFSIVRNGVEFDYPFLESLTSVLPICDELILNLGESTDSTEATLQKFLKEKCKESDAAKVKILKTRWPFDDPEKRKGGLILSEQTNLALAECRGVWCLYLQADEVLHQEDWPKIRTAAKKYEKQSNVNAFVFDYVHFYADYQTIQTSRSSYRREIRMIRNGQDIVSIGDAQSFRHKNGAKPQAVLLGAKIYHYGWVKNQEVMKLKTGFMDTLYHQGAEANAPATGQNYLFKRFVGLNPFSGTHPEAMKNRIAAAGSFDFSRAPRVFQINDLWKIVSGWIERVTGLRPFEFKNYRLVDQKSDKQ